jgi:hypothetical protein
MFVGVTGSPLFCLETGDRACCQKDIYPMPDAGSIVIDR